MIEDNKKILHEYFEPDFPAALVKNVLQYIDDFYFRSQFIGFDDFPKRNQPNRPLIFASNHSGMAFPWDAIIFTAGIYRLNNYQFYNSLRALTAPMLSYSTLMNPFLLRNFWRRAGGVDATFLNFETMMQHNESNLLVYPEGVPGIGKGFDKKYQLQRFSTSFVRLSIKYKTDIIPVSTVNGEYINPYSLHSDIVNKIVNVIGIPFIPIGVMTLFIPFQPWLFYFGFPAKLTYVAGERIKPYEWIDKPYKEITSEEFNKLTGRVREIMQRQLNTAVAEYGREPYKFGELLKTCMKNRKKFPFFIPCFWPSLFQEFQRLHIHGQKSELKLGFMSGIRALFKNPITIAFFLPIIGWIPILIQGLRYRLKS